MIIKIQTNKKTLIWNSQKCKPLQVMKNFMMLCVPFAAIAIAQILGGVEVMM